MDTAEKKNTLNIWPLIRYLTNTALIFINVLTNNKEIVSTEEELSLGSNIFPPSP